MVIKTAFAAACASMAMTASAEYTIEDFQTKLFWKRPDQGYYDVDVGLPSTGDGTTIMSVSDLNNDKLNDLVTIDQAGNTVTVYYFSEDTTKFTESSTFSLPDGYLVENVIPTNSPQALQSLIFVASSTNAQGTSQTQLFQYSQTENLTAAQNQKYVWTEATGSDLKNLSILENTQPMALDINGDQAMDLLYQSSDNGIQVALGSRNDILSYEVVPFFDTFVTKNADNSDCATPNTSDIISIPNSNAFIDLNGDCVPELIITRQNGSNAERQNGSQTVNTYYEIYSQTFVNDKSMYCLATQEGTLVASTDTRNDQVGSAPMPFIEFADFNRDGMIDMSFTSETGVLTVLLNQYSSPGPKSTNLCNDVDNTAQLKKSNIFPEFPFSSSQKDVVQEKLGQLDDGIEYSGITQSIKRSTQNSSIPGRVRCADVDGDGYPDFVMTLSFFIPSSSSSITRSVILLNKEADDGERYLDQIKSSGDSYLAKVIQEAGDTSNFLSFLDIDDDGKLDFVLQKNNDVGVPTVKVLFNNVVSDNFFMKAASVNSELKKSQNIYNDYVVGSSYRFVITDLDDRKLVMVGSQRFQSGYMSLQLPFAFLGVGRSNNYIESFFAATGIDGKRTEHMWTPIIPNSQLIIFMNSNDETNWGLELFISPTASLYVIVMVCAVCLLIIGLAIIWLHVKEKQEDAKKREQHFDFF